MELLGETPSALARRLVDTPSAVNQSRRCSLGVSSVANSSITYLSWLARTVRSGSLSLACACVSACTPRAWRAKIERRERSSRCVRSARYFIPKRNAR